MTPAGVRTTATRFRGLYGALWMLWSLAYLAPAHALECDSTQSYYRDRASALTPALISPAAMTAYAGVLHAGVVDYPVWIRLQLHCIELSEPAARVLVRIEPRQLDSVEAYDENTVESVRHFEPLRNLHAIMGFQFELPAGASERVIWLRVLNGGSAIVSTAILSPTESTRRGNELLTVLLIFVIVAVAVSIFAILQVVVFFDALQIGFAVYQFGTALYLLLGLAMGLDAWPDSWTWVSAHDLTRAVGIMTAASGVYFQTTLMRDYHPPARMLRFSLVLIAGLLLDASLMLCGFSTVAAHGFAALLLANVVYFTMLAFSSSRFGTTDATVESNLGYFLIMTLTFALSLYRLMMIVAIEGLGFRWSFSPALFLTAITIILSIPILLITWRRTWLRVRHLNSQKLRADLAEQQAGQERAESERQQTMLAMLTHELRTPLSVIGLATDQETPSLSVRQRASRAIRDISRVLHNVMLADRVNNDQLSLRGTPWSVMEELDTYLQNYALAEFYTVTADEGVPRTQVNRDAGLVILTNLLDNARKYNSGLSPARIHVSADQNATGIGIRVEVSNESGAEEWPDALRLFTKYYRQPRAHRKTGAGLGLYLSKRLAGLSGCTLEYLPTDRDVRFVLWLPV